MFIDSIVINVHSGKGGDGIVHMHREKYRPRGGPDGGDGGRGGDVILQVKPTLNALNKFHSNEDYFAPPGQNGGPSNRFGKSGKNLVITVPPGTAVYNEETAELIGDLVNPGQQLVVAKGGRGGRGNQHFATSRNQMPLTAEKGEPGEDLVLRLELRLIADVGLVGLPNAGKSSILAATTNARPKVANYPFTTLEPNLGVVQLDPDISLVMADIPGLIEGASEGRGLGVEFLKHIQRTRVLIHVLDGLSEDPVKDYRMINEELTFFDERLGSLYQLVVLSKCDLPDVAEKYEGLKKRFNKLEVDLMDVSAVTHLHLKEMLWKVYQILQDTPKVNDEEELPVYRPTADPRSFLIEREDDAWRVSGKTIERAAAMTYWEHPGSVRRFQRLMNTLGIEKALKEAGVQQGDEVRVGEWDLEWQD